MSQLETVEIEETTETIGAIMLGELIALAKQVGRLELENEALIGDSYDEGSDEDSDEVIIDCANMPLRDLIELEFTDEQLVDIIAETRAELADDCD